MESWNSWPPVEGKVSAEDGDDTSTCVGASLGAKTPHPVGLLAEPEEATRRPIIVLAT